MRTSTGSRHMRRKVMPIVAIAAAGAAAGGIAVLSGCGSTAAAGSAPASIAGYIPASSPLYVQVSTDTAGTQWTNLNRLGTLFPGFGKMRAELDKALAREGIAWDAELKPLLGESAAIAITEVPETGSVLKGALTDPAGAVGRAAAKAADQPMMAVLQIASGKAADIKALITQPPGGMKETGTRDGATLYADAAMGTYAAVTEESLIVGSTEDVVAKALEVKAAGGEAALSGVFRFNEALSLLPDDVFAMGYVNVEEAGKAASEVLPQVGDLAGGQLTGAAAMSVTAQPDGLRMKAVLVDAPQAAQQTPYTPTLTAQAPADSIAYLGFNRLADTVQRAVTAASSAGSEDTKKQVDALTSQLPLLLGVNTDDLRNLTGGEHAVVVGASGKEPEAALALQVKSGAQATESLTALSRSVPVVLNQFSRSDVKVGKAAPFSESGVKGQVIPAGDMSVAWGVRGELAAIGNGAKAVVSVLAPRGAANSLAATPGFKAATQGMPAQVTGLAYVDVRKAVPVLAANGAFDGKDGAKKRANIAPLTQIAAWATAGETPTVEVYVGMGK
ncbi:MAG: DUF3352 domain-containing protein [Miltoncostaeaceae bacterium]